MNTSHYLYNIQYAHPPNKKDHYAYPVCDQKEEATKKKADFNLKIEAWWGRPR